MDKRLHYLWAPFPDAQHNIFSMQCNRTFYLTQSAITPLPQETFIKERPGATWTSHRRNRGKSPACTQSHAQHKNENIDRLNVYDTASANVNQAIFPCEKVREMWTSHENSFQYYTYVVLYVSFMQCKRDVWMENYWIWISGLCDCLAEDLKDTSQSKCLIISALI